MFRDAIDNHLVVCTILEYIHPDKTPQLRLVFKTLSAEKDLLKLAKMGCFIPAVKTSSMAREILVERGVLNLHMPFYKPEAILFDGVIGAEVNAKYWAKSILTRMRWYGDDVTYANLLAAAPYDIDLPHRELILSIVINACHSQKASYTNIDRMLKAARVGPLHGVSIHAAHYVIKSYDSDYRMPKDVINHIIASYTQTEWYDTIDCVSFWVRKKYPPTPTQLSRFAICMLESDASTGSIMASMDEHTFARAISIANISDRDFMRLLNGFNDFKISSRHFHNTPRGKLAEDHFAKNNKYGREWGTHKEWQY